MLFGSACFVCSFIASLVHWNTSRPLCLVPMCGRVCVCVVVFFSTNTWEHWGSRTKCTLLYCIIQDQIYLNLTLNRTLRTGLEKKKMFSHQLLIPPAHLPDGKHLCSHSFTSERGSGENCRTNSDRNFHSIPHPQHRMFFFIYISIYYKINDILKIIPLWYHLNDWQMDVSCSLAALGCSFSNFSTLKHDSMIWPYDC